MSNKIANTARNRQRLWAALLAGAVTVYIGLEFFMAARATLQSTRDNACRALEPTPIPQKLSDTGVPAFSLPDSEGQMRSLDEFRGRPVVLNFWATWCPPCVEEMPALEALARRLGDKAVVLAISVDDDWTKVKHFFRKGTALTVLLDHSAELPKRFGTEKYPETFLIGADGKLRHYIVNKRKWDSHQAIECILGLR